MLITRVLIALIIVPLGIYAVWTALHGLSTGEIPQIQKHGHAMVFKAVKPITYWVTEAVWGLLGSVAIVGGVRTVKHNLS